VVILVICLFLLQKANQTAATKWGLSQALGGEGTAELLATKVQEQWQSDCVLAIDSLEEGLSDAGKAVNVVNIAVSVQGKIATKELKMPKLSFGWQKERMALAALVLLLDSLG